MIPDIDQSTGILFGMACTIITLCLLLAYFADELIRTKAQVAEDVDEASDVMIDAVVFRVGQVLLAERLREIARNYESTENILLRMEIGRTKWKEGGTPLPALWLMAIADEISPEFPETETFTEYTLDGTAHTYERNA